MNQLAQMKVPSNDPEGGTVAITAPTGISSNLTSTSDVAFRAFTKTAFDWIFYVAIILAVLFIMWSGIQWTTSGGDVARLEAAKRRLTFAIIGLVIVLMAFVIVRVVITTIGGNSDAFFSPLENIQQTPATP